VRAVLRSRDGTAEYAVASFSVASSAWRRFSASLSATATDTDAVLAITYQGPGALCHGYGSSSFDTLRHVSVRKKDQRLRARSAPCRRQGCTAGMSLITWQRPAWRACLDGQPKARCVCDIPTSRTRVLVSAAGNYNILPSNITVTVGSGDLLLDMVSLTPAENAREGELNQWPFRGDLLDALKALKPRCLHLKLKPCTRRATPYWASVAPASAICTHGLRCLFCCCTARFMVLWFRAALRLHASCVRPAACWQHVPEPRVLLRAAVSMSPAVAEGRLMRTQVPALPRRLLRGGGGPPARPIPVEDCPGQGRGPPGPLQRQLGLLEH
jgi:hypothetical protein